MLFSFQALSQKNHSETYRINMEGRKGGGKQQTEVVLELEKSNVHIFLIH